MAAFSRGMIGETIAGRYRVESQLGSGGMGVVYRARAGEQVVAIKVLRDDVAAVEHFSARFAREVDLAARVAHPHIVRVEEAGRARGGAYLVMELVEAPTLTELLERSGRLPWQRAVALSCQLLGALGALHEEEVVHRDLKPDNLFVLPGDRLKLFDFGLAKRGTPEIDDEDGRALTRPGFAIGTPSYLAPERVAGSDADPRSDLYAVGVLLFEMLTGAPPFRGDEIEDVLKGHLLAPPPSLQAVAPGIDLPPSLEAIVLRALAKDPSARYQDARAFEAELSALRRELEGAATVVSPAPMPAPRAARRAPRWLADVRHWSLARTALVAAAVGASGALVAAAIAGGGAEPAPVASAATVVEAQPDRLAPALARELAVTEAAWAAAEVELVDVEPEVGHGGAPCGRGRAAELDARVCVFADEEAARSAERAALAEPAGVTQVALASGPSLLVLTDTDASDPEGRRIQRLLELFLARHEAL